MNYYKWLIFFYGLFTLGDIFCKKLSLYLFFSLYFFFIFSEFIHLFYFILFPLFNKYTFFKFCIKKKSITSSYIEWVSYNNHRSWNKISFRWTPTDMIKCKYLIHDIFYLINILPLFSKNSFIFIFILVLPVKFAYYWSIIFY